MSQENYNSNNSDNCGMVTIWHEQSKDYVATYQGLIRKDGKILSVHEKQGWFQPPYLGKERAGVIDGYLKGQDSNGKLW